MLVVVDASVLVPALADHGPHGAAARHWLTALAGTEPLHILQNLTKLEFVSSLRELVDTGRLDAADAEHAIRDFVQLPLLRHEITQPMITRIWELRGHLTPYAASYVALVERLSAESRTPACLATADAQLQCTPGLSIAVELFTD